ncbi:MAG: hypothetical protein AAF713_01080 [Pseudomonadota bacterium]
MVQALRPMAVSLFILLLAASPVAAEERRSPLEDWADRFSETFDDLVDQLGPKIEEAEEFFGVLGRIDDIGNYHSPEILPNGDIVMRRRADAPDWSPEPEAKPAPEATLPYDPGEGVEL